MRRVQELLRRILEEIRAWRAEPDTPVEVEVTIPPLPPLPPVEVELPPYPPWPEWPTIELPPVHVEVEVAPINTYDPTATPLYAFLNIGDLWVCPPGHRAAIRRLIAKIVAEPPIRTHNYGRGPALEDGIRVVYVRDGTEFDLTGGVPVKANGDWGGVCYDVKREAWGTNDQYVHARWTFSEPRGGLTVWLNAGDSFEIRSTDTFGPDRITTQTFMIQGALYALT